MKEKEKFLQRLVYELETRKKRLHYRNLNPKIHTRIDFSSNDYLGLNHKGILLKFLKEVLDDFHDTVGSTGSRLISGHRDIFELIEKKFSLLVDVPDSLLFHSGYVGNLSTIEALISPRDVAFVDRLSHASIIDGVRISKAKKIYFHHNDLQHLEDLLKKTRRNPKSEFWIFTEAVFSMDGDVPPLVELLELCEKYSCNLFLDEAHSIGVYGKSGKGLAYDLGVQKQVSVLVFPMGKAPGVMGCFVSGETILKEYLINFARGFIYSTAQPIFLVPLLGKVIDFLESDEAERYRSHLWDLSNYARENLKLMGFHILNSVTQIIPVLIPDEEKLMAVVNELRKRFDVVAIRPPTVPVGSSRIRVNLHAHNTKDEVDELLEAFLKLRDKFLF
ncbi:MAG: pyridoxal phosphate-dependent aminotransferase family protein [Leptospiraceae bacterium]|nr:pyridoxal phosphate-dependent aminotransferase family protein [Leptospiraceae bacterium]MDW7975607.1 pyridoxal phosphate-dependent aminotransferase family protein [Leptospiraceae bacterium]